LVQELDLTPLYAQIKAVEGHAGRPAVDPRVLVALWIYATEEGVGKARELYRRCYDCDPYKWLRGGVEVNYRTLSDFRTQHPEWLKEQVITNIATLRAEGLASLDVLGQDGMRVRAWAGNDSFKREAKLQEVLHEAKQKWDRLQQEFEQETKLSASEQAAQERAARERIERLKQAQQEIQKVAKAREKRKKGDGDSARASTTDPEARRMKMGDGGTRPAYNIEFSTDLNSLVIMGFDVTNAGSDAGQLELMTQPRTSSVRRPGAGESQDGRVVVCVGSQFVSHGRAARQERRSDRLIEVASTGVDRMGILRQPSIFRNRTHRLQPRPRPP
jgi:transposase